ncbi:MAG: enoyl-CoA hydratase-related protein, partial [Ilumatobacteraceae bacterium]
MHNPAPATVITETRGPVAIITINRPEVRNAVDGRTADGLREAFEEFESAPDLRVAVLTGAEGTFCAGADLKAISTGAGNRIEADMSLPGPMGPTRMTLSKPTIAAVEGHAVAGG